ncbi:uncharacterized protein LOC108851078 [Raphanus sativus]|uniref:Uncharacterized protein LOC108851078 n=1 Tax=Raphanus sativus TaxID=3726 RepID=A0A9W3DEW0_RAPSA|nr:uncharacterized protein LOC108851078 [Raphanus sativus]
MDTHFWSPGHSDDVPQDDEKWFLTLLVEDTSNFSSPYHCGDCLENIDPFDVDECSRDCDSCSKMWHLDCIPDSPDDINHPFHSYHPLELLIDVPQPPDQPKGRCDACQQELNSYFYHCSLCDFSMHVRCSKNPPPPIVETPKCHEHTLTCMVRNDTFTCNACGTHGELCPYVCAPCGVMFHQECIDLPHVININRHDHRVSHAYSLGFGNRKCMICLKVVDWRYGAYSCSTCPDYVVHSKCATRLDVWDGEELEGVPEEYFDVSPFEVIEEGVSIKHFSHEEHILYRIEDDEDDILDGSMRCEACVHPIFSETHYKCMDGCEFILHEACANLPLRKRHWLSTTPFYLNANNDETNESMFRCGACQTISNGFRYESDEGVTLDMRCAFVISAYCDYECHPHTLFLTIMDKGFCGGCKLTKKHVLRCTESECDFSLCLVCATLPKKIERKAYEHFLFLCHGEKASGPNDT